MITIISGTNRKDSVTGQVSSYLLSLLKEAGMSSQLLSLEGLEGDLLHDEMYAEAGQSAQIKNLQDRYITEASKLIIISPEYNGSFPGILKLFIDAISVRNYASNFKNKKIALVGVSSGWAGNFRGMDHLAEILAHQGGVCLPKRMALPNIGENFDKEGVKNEKLKGRLIEFIDTFDAF